jgi:flagellar basal body-associated protein FliL
MKKIVIIAVGLVLLGGGGFLGAKQAGLLGDGKPKEPSQKEKLAAVVSPYFFAMEQILVPILRDGHTYMILKLQVSLQLDKPESSSKAQANKNQLRNDIILDLKQAASMPERFGQLDEDLVKKRILAMAKARIGDEVVTDVLLQELTRHPTNMGDKR